MDIRLQFWACAYSYVPLGETMWLIHLTNIIQNSEEGTSFIVIRDIAHRGSVSYEHVALFLFFSHPWSRSLPRSQMRRAAFPMHVSFVLSSYNLVGRIQLQGIFLAFSSTAVPKESSHCKRNEPMNPNGSTSSIRISAPVSAPSQIPGFTSLSNNF